MQQHASRDQLPEHCKSYNNFLCVFINVLNFDRVAKLIWKAFNFVWRGRKTTAQERCNVHQPGGPVRTFEKFGVKHARLCRYLRISRDNEEGRKNTSDTPPTPARTKAEKRGRFRRSSSRYPVLYHSFRNGPIKNLAEMRTSPKPGITLQSGLI